jgi:hypothetical protein
MIIKTTASARLDYELLGEFNQAELSIFRVFMKPGKLPQSRFYLVIVTKIFTSLELHQG